MKRREVAAARGPSNRGPRSPPQTPLAQRPAPHPAPQPVRGLQAGRSEGGERLHRAAAPENAEHGFMKTRARASPPASAAQIRYALARLALTIKAFLFCDIRLIGIAFEFAGNSALCERNSNE
jgi:hypothetical protein